MENTHRYFRTIEVAVVGLFGALGVLLFVRGVWIAAIALLAFAAMAAAMFELRLRAHRRNVARVRAALERVARELGGGAVERHTGDEYLEELGTSWFARSLARRSERLYVRGKRNGTDVEVGTAVVAARDMDVLISYAYVLDGAHPPFRAMTRGMITSIARKTVKTNPMTTGDDAFDEAWVVDADEPVGRAVLDAPVRGKLLRLAGQLPMFGIASVETVSRGVIVRSPGDPALEGVVGLCDLALEVRDRLAA